MANDQIENLSASLEDYLETIYALSEGDDKVARSKDIAERLNVAKSSVTGALRQLAERGLVNYKPYEYITLTDEGRISAEIVVQKHQIIQSFFEEVLGVDSKLAEDAACKAEHALGESVVSKLLDFTEFIKTKQSNGADILSDFKKYLRDKS